MLQSVKKREQEAAKYKAARQAAEDRHNKASQPRYEKVSKRRLKPRPYLPPEFAESDSVYFRKPGNESVVGSGTYGKVFKAIHVYTNDLVALKKIRMEGERDGVSLIPLNDKLALLTLFSSLSQR